MNKTIFAIAEKENHKIYAALSIKGEGIETSLFEEGLDKIKTSEADVIILDCGNKAQKGLQLLSSLRAIRQDIPIIFITDENSANVVIQAFRMGVRQYFQKPINILELEETIGELIRIKRTSKERRTAFFQKQVSSMEGTGKSATTDKPINLLMVIQHIEDHVCAKITLEELAQKAGMSKYHFSRVFKRYIGMTPIKFVTLRKIEKAKELLKRHDFNVSSVAYQLGFNDASTFIKQFKKFTGLTPAKVNNKH
jgi:YesN/AraC family two-component response regulator